MPVSAPQGTLRTTLRDRYIANRRRSESLFALVAPAALLDRPIHLRHPILFYIGHIPAFSFNTLVRRGLGGASIDTGLEALFARGIDPDSNESAARSSRSIWPDLDEVNRFVASTDAAVLDAIKHSAIDVPGVPLLDHAEAAWAILEHEEMHHETLLYMLRRLPYDRKIAPAGFKLPSRATPSRAEPETVHIRSGIATIGSNRGDHSFVWDNELEPFCIEVDAFEIDMHNVTNARFLEFVEAGGYQNESLWTPSGWTWLTRESIHHPLFWEQVNGSWFWRGMFELIPLPVDWPVWVSHAEASAFARWQGARLPTELEYHRAAFGTPAGPEMAFPWGSDPPRAKHGNFGFRLYEPEPIGSRPEGVSAWGVHDLIGNGWEWTSTIFGPFEGFQPTNSYPEYSADFFDDLHFVTKGASPATATTLIRRGFRNWFRAEYPYVNASFRCVR